MGMRFIYIFAVVASLGATLFQIVISPILFTTLGFRRVLQPLESFNVSCEKLDGFGLEGCEEMWFHTPSGLLYMACSETDSRIEWLPCVDHLNASGRTGNDRMAILDTRAPGPVSSRLKWMKTVDFAGNQGDGTIDLHGFDIKPDETNPKLLKILLINHRPPYHPETGALLDASKIGANSTVELFEATLGETEMRYIKTYIDDKVMITPNNIAWTNSGGFLMTNDRSRKVGLRRTLDPFFGGGSVVYCDDAGCHVASSDRLKFPNGLVRGADGLIYVPSSVTGKIDIFKLEEDNTLTKVCPPIELPQPLDNLSVDGNGGIYASSFPSINVYQQSYKQPRTVHPPTAGWSIKKTGECKYEVLKLLEDDGTSLPVATSLWHDSKTGRLFFAGKLTK